MLDRDGARVDECRHVSDFDDPIHQPPGLPDRQGKASYFVTPWRSGSRTCWNLGGSSVESFTSTFVAPDCLTTVRSKSELPEGCNS